MLTEIRKGFTKIIRWQKFVHHLPIRSENLVEHTIDTALIALIVSEVVDLESPELKLDKHRILACALLHDVPEVRTGDIAYAEKKATHEIDEALAFRSMFRAMPEHLRRRLEHSFSLQSGLVAKTLENEISCPTPEALVFEFVERFGYLLFALEQFREDIHSFPLLTHVLQLQTERLVSLISALPALGQILNPSSLQQLQTELQSNELNNVKR